MEEKYNKDQLIVLGLPALKNLKHREKFYNVNNYIFVNYYENYFFNNSLYLGKPKNC